MKGFAAVIILLCVVVISFISLNTNNYTVENDSQKEMVSRVNQVFSNIEVMIKLIEKNCQTSANKAGCIDGNVGNLNLILIDYSCSLEKIDQSKIKISCDKNYPLNHKTSVRVSKEIRIST